MKTPFVSFCFTTYKRDYYLRKTLESVARQTYPHFEVIVSDNDPEGSGHAVVEAFNDQRFKYFPNGENLGMKKSFNRSLERSSGDFIVMIADDDPVYPEMLETLVNLHNSYPDYGLYLGGCNWFCTHPDIAALYKLKVGMNSCLAQLPIGTVKTYSPEQFLKEFFNFGIFPSYLWSTAMVKREVLIEKGGVPDYNTAFLGDYAYLSIMSSHSGCVVINDSLGHQTIHEQNFGRAQNEQIRTAAVNFVDYVSGKIRHVKDWPVIEENMKTFVALWVITHLAFLKRYYSKFSSGEVNLLEYEKDVFEIPFVRKYRNKYLLKTKTPALHDFLVSLKRKIR
jgi:glycosyltransferase involved in cell wall biosynthesis